MSVIIFFLIFCISRLKIRTVVLKSCGSFAISCQKFLATTWTTKAKPKMKIMVSWVVEFSVWGIFKNKLVGSVLNLQANEQSQSSTSRIHLGWIGCADYLVISLSRSENSTNYRTKFSDVTILPQHAPNRANDGRWNQSNWIQDQSQSCRWSRRCTKGKHFRENSSWN